jgi:hypothetical protein
MPLEWFVERLSAVPRTELPAIARGLARGSNRFHILDELGRTNNVRHPSRPLDSAGLGVHHALVVK